MQPSTIYIIGTGAIGQVLAACLHLQGRPVVLVRASVDNLPSRIQSVTVELPGATSLQALLEVHTLSHFEELNGIVVLTNKSFGNGHLAAALRNKISTSPIVILQNGLYVEQPFTGMGYSSIYRCVLMATSQLISDQRYRFKLVAPSPIGVIQEQKDKLPVIVEQLNTDSFPFRAETDIRRFIWMKVIVNSVFNSICPLLEADNGIFYRNASCLQIARRVIAECVAIARLEGVELEEEQIAGMLLLISRSSEGQLISTYQDILHKRPTEMNSLNDAIARIARRINAEKLVTETRLLGELIQIKSGIVGTPAAR